MLHRQCVVQSRSRSVGSVPSPMFDVAPSVCGSAQVPARGVSLPRPALTWRSRLPSTCLCYDGELNSGLGGTNSAIDELLMFCQGHHVCPREVASDSKRGARDLMGPICSGRGAVELQILCGAQVPLKGAPVILNRVSRGVTLYLFRRVRDSQYWTELPPPPQ